METETLKGLLKQASEQIHTSQDVIRELALNNQDLQHKLAARDLVIKVASLGAVAPADLSEKVAEFEGKSAEDLVLEEKVASMGGFGHSLQTQTTQHAPTGALEFLNPSN